MKTIKAIFISLFVLLIGFSVLAEEKEYPPYYKVATVKGSMSEVAASVRVALESKDFKVIGEYQPGNNDSLMVLCYTRKDFAGISLKFEDRGALAGVMKVGLKNNDGNIDVSMINPMYIFYAYFYEGIDPYIGQLEAMAKDVNAALSAIGNDFEPFGGFEEREDLEDYRYKIMMPYFTDPVELTEYNSFEEGLSVIRKNLDAGIGNTVKVYEVVYPGQKIALFGVGLLDPEDGEADFLPTIGEDHVAAMPYEIILQDKEVTMLPGRYRIALHWPELGMGTFMKIMSTPGNIEDFMLGVTEIDNN
ncbi:MAG: hypothetical protein KAJ50_07280 [Bacteroidales bacterium]|nr:hypothetical protein [Bacteroidales bacterium]